MESNFKIRDDIDLLCVDARRDLGIYWLYVTWTELSKNNIFSVINRFLSGKD